MVDRRILHDENTLARVVGKLSGVHTHMLVTDNTLPLVFDAIQGCGQGRLAVFDDATAPRRFGLRAKRHGLIGRAYAFCW